MQGKIPSEKAFSCQLSLNSFPLSKDVVHGLYTGHKNTYLSPQTLSFPSFFLPVPSLAHYCRKKVNIQKLHS